MNRKLLSKTVSSLLGCVILITSCQSPDSVTDQSHPLAIKDQYIVTLKALPYENARLSGTYNDRVAMMEQQATRLLKQFKFDPALVEQVYTSVMTGFSARLTPEQVEQLQKSPYVSRIESDRLMAVTEPKRVDEAGARPSAKQETPWGIAAVGGPTNYTGSNVAWIVDTGIDLDHPDLNVDAKRGKNFVITGQGSTSLDDNHGHGTHMAGIIAAKNNTYGVVGIAAGATVIPVKVGHRFNDITLSTFIAGIDYVAANAKAGDVVNLSVGAQDAPSADEAVLRLAQAVNVFIAISAGNTYEVTDANRFSPGRVNGPTIFTASAHNSKGVFAKISCSGNPPIDFAAPGVSIKSTVNNGGYTFFSEGTSMSTAHLAGILLATGGKIYGKGFVTGDRDGNPDPKASRIP
ncbi:peptidase S8/S53 subtilisin kexin sedolisin [Fibrisoma limi BUZ 3]|uniref:Peptidase S8/S53 subtilisin kexin sedolisin n=1 Tax=Fibrisoma limi BUZ 3 TaxID=1185876 RepID=I2GLP9_9BACT|nr:S8 family serine peptidase [Fibrisoma limi]CCH54825.1 peptidase S8/S53 subtilisin kexin sedolisin [Fibrisoma limi BUZ 3]